MDAFTQAYITCALWASLDNYDETGGEPLDANYSLADIAPETLERMREDCALFQATHVNLLAQAGNDEQNGHDYWLTRNHHGAGFWDRGYPSTVGDALTKAANADGSVDLYVGDDGKIYA